MFVAAACAHAVDRLPPLPLLLLGAFPCREFLGGAVAVILAVLGPVGCYCWRPPRLYYRLLCLLLF